MEILETNNLIAPAYESMRQNRWVLSFDGQDAFIVHNFKRPSLTVHETVIPEPLIEKPKNLFEVIINKFFGKNKKPVLRYFKTKHEWNTLDLTMYEPISPSAAQKFMEWLRLGFQNLTGKGYVNMQDMVTDKLAIKLIDPIGAVVETWNFKGLFPIEMNFGSLDFADPQALQINARFRIDEAIINY